MDDPGQAVAGQEELVAWRRVAAHDLDLDRLRRADRARDQVRILVGFGFLGAEHARIDEVLHQAVVAAYAHDLTAADAVGAAVPHPEAAVGAVGDGEADHRRADGALPPRPGKPDQFAIDLAQRFDRAGGELIEVRDQGQAAQRVGHHRARDLAGVVTAHPVGHGPQPALRIDENGILVDLPP